eukprot:991404_1
MEQMRQYMAALQERANKEPIIDGPEYILHRNTGMVQNGERYSKAEIVTDIDFKYMLIVPQSAKVIQNDLGTKKQNQLLICGFAKNYALCHMDNINKLILKYYYESIIQIYIVKRLTFYGHPPASIDIRVCHKNMGIATREADSCLFVGSYGEWCNMEGAAEVYLVFLVPKQIPHKKSNVIRGVDGEGDTVGGWWYGASNCNKDWIKIKEEADPQHWFKELSKTPAEKKKITENPTN